MSKDQSASRSDEGKRTFTTCKDHAHVHLDWNEPDLDYNCILCRLFYLEAQESLLEEWQQRANRAEATIEEIQRPLDAQMARLNENLTAANDRIAELERAAAVSERGEPPTDAEVAAYRDLFRVELDKNMNNSSGSPSTDAHRVALSRFVASRYERDR